MFAFTKAQQYRKEVLAGVHTILNAVPDLKTFLSTIPNLNNTIDTFKDAQPTPLDSAAWVSMAVLETIIDRVPLQTRSLVLQQITQTFAAILNAAEPGNEDFLYFLRMWQALKTGELLPQGMPLLTITLGVAFGYLYYAEGQGKLSAQTRETFVTDVGGMLRGISSEERAGARAQVALKYIFGQQN